MEPWRQQCITTGSLKQVDLHTGTNGWSSPPCENFSLRAPNYFTTKSKTPAAGDSYLLNPAGVDWLRSASKLDHLLARPDNRVINALNTSNSKSFLIAVNLQIPGRDHHSAVFYFSTKPHDHELSSISSNRLLNSFVNGSDSYRNSRFKIVNKIVKGPWIVKAAVGNYSACLLGKALKCYYYRGPNYLEIDVDIGSSAIATAILRLALGCVTAVTVDMGFLVEGQTEEELPERLFGAVRISQMEMSSATFVESGSAAAAISKVLPVDSTDDDDDD